MLQELRRYKFFLLLFICYSPFCSGQTAFDPHYFVSLQPQREALHKDQDDWQIPADLAHRIDFNPNPQVTLYRGSARNALVVMQGDFAVLSKESPFDVLASNGAVPCVIVAIYDDRTGTIGMAHSDTMLSAEKTLARMLARFREVGALPTRAFLAGAASDRATLNRWATELANQGIANIQFERSSSLAINRAGNLFNNSIQSDNVFPVQKRREILAEFFAKVTQPGQLLSRISKEMSPTCPFACAVEISGRTGVELYPRSEFPKPQ